MAKLKVRGAIIATYSTDTKNDKLQANTNVKKKVTTSYKVPPLSLRNVSQR